MSGFCRCLIGSAYEESSLFAIKLRVRMLRARKSNMEAYACARVATLSINTQAFSFVHINGQQKWLAELNLVQLYSAVLT